MENKKDTLTKTIINSKDFSYSKKDVNLKFSPAKGFQIADEIPYWGKVI
jgi:hypothetical protein